MRLMNWTIALSSVLVACAPDGAPTTVTFKTTSGSVDAVAYREDGAAWKTATRVELDTYTLDVSQRPYWVSVVCHRVFGARIMMHYARSADDPPEIADALCPEDDPVLYAVHGRMVQPGSVAMTSWVRSNEPDWRFQQYAPPGSYTLYAASDSHVLIQRDLQINDNIDLPAIDVDASGTPLITQPFTIANPHTGEGFTQRAVIGIEPSTASPSNETPLYLYQGDLATAQVIPSAALSSHDIQTVSLRETTSDETHNTLRAYRKGYRVGDPTELTLPESLGDVTWSTDGQISATWSARSTDAPMLLQIIGYDGITQSIDASAAFLNDTGRRGLTFDTSAPGFDDSWAIDVSRAHLFVASSQIIGETVDAPRLSVSDTQFVDDAPEND